MKPLPLEGKVIVLDAGHGGLDPGAIGSKYHSLESNIALFITLNLKEELEDLGAIVVMTRVSNRHTPLARRVGIANAIMGADLFVSVHLNGADNPNAQGNEVLFHDRSRLGPQIAECIMQRLASMPHTVRGAKSDFVLFPQTKRNPRGGAYVLRETKMPAVLVECEFITNPKMEEKLVGEAYQETYARLIAEGIVDFYTK